MTGVLCAICARSGSQGVPGKNIRPLLGKPLIVWSIEHALATPEIDRVIVSTDSPKIAAIAEAAGAAVPFLRPAKYATAEASKFVVWRHALETSEAHFGERYDIFVDLDCTGIVRTPDDVSAAIQMFRERRPHVDLVMTVTPARRNPYFNLFERGTDGALHLSKEEGTGIVRRQDAPACFDAVANIYVMDSAYARRMNTLFDGVVHGFEVTEEQGFDVDNELDFEIIEMIMARRLGMSRTM